MGRRRRIHYNPLVIGFAKILEPVSWCWAFSCNEEKISFSLEEKVYLYLVRPACI